jgi:hypothetical protein
MSSKEREHASKVKQEKQGCWCVGADASKCLTVAVAR